MKVAIAALTILTIIATTLPAQAIIDQQPQQQHPFQGMQEEQQQDDQQQEDQQQEETERQFLWDHRQLIPQKTPQNQNSADPYCFSLAEKTYSISKDLLQAISKVESNYQPYVINWNTNKSYDYCHMQINSSWAPLLGTEKWNSLNNPCYCTLVGAWILSQCVQRHGYTWRAVGCYNASTTSKAIKYSRKIQKALTTLNTAKQ